MNVVNFDKMGVGLKKEGRHWTKAEVEGRRKAEEDLNREEITLTPPDWVVGYALDVWNKIIIDAIELKLFDNLDQTALATYCHLESLKVQAVNNGDSVLFEKLSKTSLMYAKVLGLTPDSRARLATKRANEQLTEEQIEVNKLFGD